MFYCLHNYALNVIARKCSSYGVELKEKSDIYR